MIALRKCDSRTGLILLNQDAFRLGILRRRSLSRLSQSCEDLPTAVLLKCRTSIKIAIFRYQQFNIFDSLCQYNLCRFFKNRIQSCKNWDGRACFEKLFKFRAGRWLKRGADGSNPDVLRCKNWDIAAIRCHPSESGGASSRMAQRCNLNNY